jgi:CBS domain-containing protein
MEAAMNAGDLCTREVVVAEREATVLEGARLMRTHHVGGIVVIDKLNDKKIPVGMVTDRDIVLEVVATELDASTLTMGDIMESDLAVATEDDTALAAIEKMRYKGVKRLPVVSDTGALVGLLSFSDLVEFLAEEVSHLAKVIVREQGRERGKRH